VREKATDGAGKTEFGTYGTDGAYYSILFNRVYKLQETSAPDGYSSSQLRIQYFMFYTTKYASYKSAEGIQNYVRSFVSETASFQIPNYKTSFRVYKTDAKDPAKKLTCVKFELFANQACTEKISGYQYSAGRPSSDGYTYYPDIPVPAKGTVQYYLKEMQAPQNYLLAADRVFIVNVTDEGKLSFEEMELFHFRSHCRRLQCSLIYQEGRNLFSIRVSFLPLWARYYFYRA
jgi:hypothetical protein